MKHLLLLAPLVGCAVFLGHGPHVPDDYQGMTQVTVTNAWDHDVCTFAVFKNTADGYENWLGDKSKKQNIAPGATRVFSIKPGTYHIVGGFCEGGDQLVGAVGTYGAETKTIEGPTLIALGPKHVARIAGTHTLAFAQVHAIQQSAGEAEGPAADEPAAEEAPTESAPASSSSSSSASEAAPSGPTCLAHGAVCDDEHHCCSGMACVSRTKFSDGSLGNGYCQ